MRLWPFKLSNVRGPYLIHALGGRGFIVHPRLRWSEPLQCTALPKQSLGFSLALQHVFRLELAIDALAKFRGMANGAYDSTSLYHERDGQWDGHLSVDYLESEQIRGMQFTPEQRIPLLKTLRERCPEGPFGWVAYRTCSYDDASRWQRFRSKWDQFIEHEFLPVIEVPGAKEAVLRFEIRWIEDKALANASVHEVAANYRDLYETLPPGLQHGMCLSIGEQELQSVLDSPLPTPTPIHEQLLIPFALGVDMSAGEDPARDESDAEEHNWHTSYKVALLALTGDLLGSMLRTSRSPRELSVGVGKDKIWLFGTGRKRLFSMHLSRHENTLRSRP